MSFSLNISFQPTFDLKEKVRPFQRALRHFAIETSYRFTRAWAHFEYHLEDIRHSVAYCTKQIERLELVRQEEKAFCKLSEKIVAADHKRWMRLQAVSL
jgi:hypothetical protein